MATPTPAAAPSAAKPAPRAPVMAPSWLAAQGRLPLAFIGLGLAWLVAGTALLVAKPGALLSSHASPAVVALTHAWVLGFFLSIAVGAVYQLAPVALGTTLWSERLGWWHLALHAVAVPGMVRAFWSWDMASLGHYGSALAVGALLFALNTWVTIRRSRHADVVAVSLALAAGWLVLTVLAGLLVAANRLWNFLPLDPLALLRAHAHLGLVGFFLTLLQGVTFRLVPMFTLGDVPSWREVKAGLWATQLGLVGLLPSLVFNYTSAALFFAWCVATGMLFSAAAFVRTIGTRKKRSLDSGLAAFVRGLFALGAAAVGGLGFFASRETAGAVGGWSGTAYGLLILIGGLLPVFAGMLCKIVPFLTWMRAYGPKVGRQPTPSAGALSRPALQAWSLGLQTAAVLPLCLGAILLDTRWVMGGLALLALGVGLFAAEMVGVLSHLRWPLAGTSQPPLARVATSVTHAGAAPRAALPT